LAQYDIIKDVTEKNDSAQKLLNYSQCAKGEEGDAYCNTWLTKMVLGCFNKNTIIMFTALFLYYTAVISNSFIGGGNQISWGILNWS
jgi:hypothetical protein